MTDKKNIVIKVSYPVAGKATENVAPTMVTEWNIKRIVSAVGVLLFVLAGLIYVINNDTQKADVDNASVSVNALENQVKAKKGKIKNLAKTRQRVAETIPLINSKKEPNKKAISTSVKAVIKNKPQEKIIK